MTSPDEVARVVATMPELDVLELASRLDSEACTLHAEAETIRDKYKAAAYREAARAVFRAADLLREVSVD